MSTVSDVGGLQSEGSTTSQDAPLTQQEYQLLQRLLSDPFSLPQQFKTWLVSFLETSDMNLPISAVNGLVNILGISGLGGGTLGILPAGIILPFGGAVAPTGSLLCDGAAYLISNYTRLYNAIGNASGAAPANSFLVPDLQDRIPVGRGSSGDTNVVGKNDGQAAGSRGIKHGHDSDWQPEQEIGWHNTGAASGTDINVIPLGDGFSPGEVLGHNHGSSLTRIGVNGALNAPSFITVNYIIVA